MYKYLKYIFLSLTALLWLAGCASTNYSRGHRALDNQQYSEAIRELKQAVAQDPKNIDAIRDLGIAVYGKGNLSLSMRLLRIAKMRRPDDPVISFYMGRIYEDSGDYENAIKMYRDYMNTSVFNSLRGEIENRLQVLIRMQLKKNLKEMLTREDQLSVASIPDNAVAVLYFLNLGNDQALSPLQKGLTEMLITDLSQIKSLAVIERARLQLLMEELGLGMTGLVNPANAPRLGKLLGAAQIVQGSLVQLKNNQLRIDAGYADLKDGQKIDTGEITGSLNDFFVLEKKVVFKIIDQLGVSLSTEERTAIEKVPTKNIMSFMYYCRALDLEDKGLFDQAGLSYEASLKKDPNFAPAIKGVDRVKAFAHYDPKPPLPKVNQVKNPSTANKPMRTVASNKFQKREAQQSLRDINTPMLGSRLERTAQTVSSGFMPGIESRESATEEQPIVFGTSNPIFIQIPIPIKQ